MEHDIRHRPAFALLDVDLAAGDALTAEAGAMVGMRGDVEVATQAGGGLLDSLKRSVMGGESFFTNTYTAPNGGGSVRLAPALPGDIVANDLTDEEILVQSGSFLAAEESIDLDTEFGGGRTFFGGEGLFLLRLQGTGPVYLSSYGAVESVTLQPGDRYTVDTGHIVAFERSVDFSVNRVGGLKSTLFSGEGLVCEFSGEGTLWIQSRSQDAFLTWLIPHLPTDSGDGT